MSLRDEILNAQDLTTRSVNVPAWGTTVYVRNMTGIERDQYEAMLIEKKDLSMTEKMLNMRSWLVCLCVVDENGDRVFKTDDIDAISKKAATALDTVVEVAQEVNALRSSDLDEIEGNSEASGDDDFIID